MARGHYRSLNILQNGIGNDYFYYRILDSDQALQMTQNLKWTNSVKHANIQKKWQIL